MTVKELITKLQEMPQNHQVITDRHSEYDLIKNVHTMLGFDSGGYISKPHYEMEELRSCGYVYIGI